MPGVRQWFQDASLFKFTKLTEAVTLRFNVDFFNVFNNPNNPNRHRAATASFPLVTPAAAPVSRNWVYG